MSSGDRILYFYFSKVKSKVNKTKTDKSQASSLLNPVLPLRITFLRGHRDGFMDLLLV